MFLVTATIVEMFPHTVGIVDMSDHAYRSVFKDKEENPSVMHLT